MSQAAPSIKTSPAAPPVAIALAVGAFCLLGVALLVARWQVFPPSAFRADLGALNTQASHFYGVEGSQGGPAFRWSRTISAVSLPALAAIQVVSVTLNPGRPASASAPRFRLLVGDKPVGEFTAQAGWHTYTATLGSLLYPDIRLELESDTFYPGAGDTRRLGLAVAGFQVAPLAGAGRSFGLIFPPGLWVVLALLAPLWAALCCLIRSRRAAIVGAAAGSVAPALWTLLLPSALALPLAGWVWGFAFALLALYGAHRWLRPGAPAYNALRRLGSSRWELPAVGLTCAVLAVAITWPVAARLGDSLPGWPADNFAFLYKLWWFRTALVVNHQWPLFDPNSYAPFGFNLGQGEPTLINTLPGVVIGAIFNDVVAYNLLALSSFVVSGIGGYLLVKELSGSKLAGLLGGVVFAFSPYRLAQFAGHLQLLGTGWIALSFYFAERALRTRRLKYGLFMGLCLALTALSAWYYAYMVGLAVAVYTAVRLLMLRREAPLSTLIKPLLASAITLLALAGPIAIPSLQLWAEGGLSHSAKAADENSAAPLDYFIPNELQPVWGELAMSAHAGENVIESALYLGVVTAVIAIAGWFVALRRRKWPFGGVWPTWVGMLIGAFVLSLGLTLHGLNGQTLIQSANGTAPIPMPAQLLYDWLPLFSSMRAYARFGVLAMLALAALAGLGWAVIVRRGWRFAARNSAWFTLLAIALALTDFWAAPYSWGTSRVQPTQASAYIASAPAGLVMQMPLASSQWGPALFWSTYYNKPITYGYDTFEPPDWARYKPVLARFPDKAALDLLRSWGVRYIVVSANAYGADWASTLDYFKSISGMSYKASFQEQRTWDVDPGVLDARPDMVRYADPDTLAVFELAGK